MKTGIKTNKGQVTVEAAAALALIVTIILLSANTILGSFGGWLAGEGNKASTMKFHPGFSEGTMSDSTTNAMWHEVNDAGHLTQTYDHNDVTTTANLNSDVQ